MSSLAGERPWPWLTAGAMLLAGCGVSGRADPPVTVRDSAGVSIVESSAPAWDPGEGWTVGEQPILEIGVVEGEDPYQFSMISGAFRTPSGGLVVGDARAAEVRFFGPDGSYRGAFGAPGQAPGEFQRRLVRVEPYPGDSVAAIDAVGRITIADGNGRVGRVFRPPLPPVPEPSGNRPTLFAPAAILLAFDDGSFLVSSPEVIQGEADERIRGERELLRYSAEGDPLVRYGNLPGFEFVMPDLSAPSRIDMNPFPRQTVYASSRDRLYLGTGRVHGETGGSGDGLEIRVLSLDGELRRLIRSTHLDLTLTDRHREAFREFQRSRASVERPIEAIEGKLARLKYPDRIPPYDRLVVDSEDHLWMGHHEAPGAPGAEVWSIFAPDGRLLGTVETPERLEIRQIGSDYILGIWTDELDVGYVRMYALERE